MFDDLVRTVAAGADPLIVAARGLLPAGLVYAAVQSFFASGFGADPMPYRPLPIRRCALIALMSLFALLNLWTAVPLAFIGAVGVEATLDGTGVEALRFGLASIGVLAAATYLAPMLRQALSARPFSSVGVGLALAAATGVDALDLGVTVASLVDVSEWLFGGVVRGAVLPIGAASVLFTGALAGYVRSLRRGMIMDRSARALSVGLSSDVLERLARREPVCREAVLELRLLLRNTQTRWMLVVALMFVVMVAGIGFIPLEVADLREASPMDLVNMTLFPGLFATGAFAIFYGHV